LKGIEDEKKEREIQMSDAENVNERPSGRKEEIEENGGRTTSKQRGGGKAAREKNRTD
jgi:hypothetical protein